MNKIKLISCALAILTFASCKKKEDDPPKNNPPVTTKGKQELLTNGQWQITALYIAKDGEVAYDHMPSLKACEADNFFLFNNNNTISSDEGDSKCDASVSQVTTDGEWHFNNDTTTLTFKDSKLLPMMENTITKIVLLSDAQLRLSKDTVIEYPGIGTLSGTIFIDFKNKK